jgi:hypothetical protein
VVTGIRDNCVQVWSTISCQIPVIRFPPNSVDPCAFRCCALVKRFMTGTSLHWWSFHAAVRSTIGTVCRRQPRQHYQQAKLPLYAAAVQLGSEMVVLAKAFRAGHWLPCRTSIWFCPTHASRNLVRKSFVYELTLTADDARVHYLLCVLTGCIASVCHGRRRRRRSARRHLSAPAKRPRKPLTESETCFSSSCRRNSSSYR